MMKRSTRSAIMTALAIGLVTTGANARLGEICLELPAGANVVKAEIASGCLPTSQGYKGAFVVSVDANTASIAINGEFKPTRHSPIGTADCMGSRVISEEAEAAGPRRYSVVVNGVYQGVLDAADTGSGMRKVRECFAGRSQVKQPSPDRVSVYDKRKFAEWIGPLARRPGKPFPPEKPRTPPVRAETLGGLAAQLLGNHPESMEGLPSAQITISRAKWRRLPWQKLSDYSFMAIQIEEHGYLDDSVSGKRLFASAKQHPQTGEWRVTGQWHQFMCARGERAGQWSAKPCV